ncbi:MAG: transglutaminase family protein [Xanthobacteraceae bacterium]
MPSRYLDSGRYIDSGAPDIIAFAAKATRGADTQRDKAIRIFEAVRDGISYDPYSVSLDPEDYVASAVSRRKSAYCVQKAILLTAIARAAGIPAAVGFADVKNHLSSPKLLDLMGSDVFFYHGYTALYLDERWIKVTPAFNQSLCERFGVRPLVFDGENDALFHEYDMNDRLHMEYLRDRGSFVEPPMDDILRSLVENYPRLAAFASKPRDAAFRDHTF